MRLQIRKIYLLTDAGATTQNLPTYTQHALAAYKKNTGLRLANLTTFFVHNLSYERQREVFFSLGNGQLKMMMLIANREGKKSYYLSDKDVSEQKCMLSSYKEDS